MNALVGSFNQENCDCKTLRNLREGSFEALATAPLLRRPGRGAGAGAGTRVAVSSVRGFPSASQDPGRGATLLPRDHRHVSAHGATCHVMRLLVAGVSWLVLAASWGGAGAETVLGDICKFGILSNGHRYRAGPRQQ